MEIGDSINYILFILFILDPSYKSQACLFYFIFIFTSNTECNGESSDIALQQPGSSDELLFFFPSRPHRQPWRGLFSSVLVIQWATSPPSLTEMCLCKISMWWRVSFYPGQCHAVSPHSTTCAHCLSVNSNTSLQCIYFHFSNKWFV